MIDVYDADQAQSNMGKKRRKNVTVGDAKGNNANPICAYLFRTLKFVNDKVSSN